MLNEEAQDFWEKLKGRTIRIFLANGYKYEGTLLETGVGFILIFDFVSKIQKILRTEDVKDAVIVK